MYDNPDDVLDRWFGSEIWKAIQEQGTNGCEESLEVMEQVNDQLGNLIFHLQNESNTEKILLELNYFHQLCEEYGVAEPDNNN